LSRAVHYGCKEKVEENPTLIHLISWFWMDRAVVYEPEESINNICACLQKKNGWILVLDGLDNVWQTTLHHKGIHQSLQVLCKGKAPELRLFDKVLVAGQPECSAFTHGWEELELIGLPDEDWHMFVQ
jgi:hypothetical protein